MAVHCPAPPFVRGALLGRLADIKDAWMSQLKGAQCLVAHCPLEVPVGPQLHERYRAALDATAVDPLLLVPTYVLDFLCIHPFADGNGRMARLLSLLLLYQAGYEVGRYISLETAIEEMKEAYYDSLYTSSQGWHEALHSLVPWWEYFVGVMLLKAYRQLEERVGVTTARRGAKRDMIRDAVSRLPNRFRDADLERALPAVSPTDDRARPA